MHGKEEDRERKVARWSEEVGARQVSQDSHTSRNARNCVESVGVRQESKAPFGRLRAFQVRTGEGELVAKRWTRVRQRKPEPLGIVAQLVSILVSFWGYFGGVSCHLAESSPPKTSQEKTL